ncbi:MAG: mandelate racemase/muconate lactonizing enzyme family protein, partial [Actinobacteria bacterium]|nr:mandelate racemase/muconate lactonizing enzyme family protein [Actinomycetota bacterium]
MLITEVRAIGLSGATPKGGWRHELRPSDVAHTLIEVVTDEGLVGRGSVFTTDALVRGALKVLAPLYERENALEPQRVTEKLHQNSFWLGRGGAITHAISGIDIALWDILGQATGQPVGRLLGGRYRDRVRPYASVLAQDAEPLVEHLLELKKTG